MELETLLYVVVALYTLSTIYDFISARRSYKLYKQYHDAVVAAREPTEELIRIKDIRIAHLDIYNKSLLRYVNTIPEMVEDEGLPLKDACNNATTMSMIDGAAWLMKNHPDIFEQRLAEIDATEKDSAQ